MSREPLLGGRAMGLSIARGLPGIRQVVGREVSLRQSSGGARLRSWGVGFHPAPVGVRWWCLSIYMIEQWPTKRHNSGMQATTHATKRVRLAAAYTVAAQAVLSEPNTGTTEQDHYEAFKVFLNWKHVRQKRAATVIQRFYRRRRIREEFKLINVSRHQITGKITLVYDR